MLLITLFWYKNRTMLRDFKECNQNLNANYSRYKHFFHVFGVSNLGINSRYFCKVLNNNTKLPLLEHRRNFVYLFTKLQNVRTQLTTFLPCLAELGPSRVIPREGPPVISGSGIIIQSGWDSFLPNFSSYLKLYYGFAV